ncbi:agmatine deiminase family protein [Gloeobacter kilaueensis]|uniref:Agmatine deiminase n=1 Tax=Gloeobacter kilaueensis (strain ATCC BAA-2537 / CCAP 1431/1 / ULC 316 / JS1) TaxID=1183438 RepID=U5QMC1_GLOK1|nr:agmatine deiminase family protein [Gloeobacter kilaueensis]AGY58795.1 agmatine deiminase [Gloeobacter kilaueensis JS1]
MAAACAYHQPAEWQPHAACWLAWPSDASLWEQKLPKAQQEFAALCRAIADPDPRTGERRGEQLEILVPDAEREQEARLALEDLSARFHRIPFGDIWLRDTAPIFVVDSQDRLSTVRFAFNGWGNKYILPGDSEVSEAIASRVGLMGRRFAWILEGGSVEVDGEGTCLTTRECLLNPNRNPGLDTAAIEKGLQEALGVRRVLWLERGLLNDHTDGHIDTLVRFVAPAKVVCMEACEPDDPNREVLEAIAEELSRFRDAQERPLEIARIPSPGRILDEDGTVMPASYVNFYIANRTVVVPTYGSPYDEEAVQKIGTLFPGRRTVGLSARAILSGGGAFHCITQQQPGL